MLVSSDGSSTLKRSLKEIVCDPRLYVLSSILKLSGQESSLILVPNKARVVCASSVFAPKLSMPHQHNSTHDTRLRPVGPTPLPLLLPPHDLPPTASLTTASKSSPMNLGRDLSIPIPSAMEYAIMKQKMFPGPTPLPPLLRPHGLTPHGLYVKTASQSSPMNLGRTLSIPLPSAMEYAFYHETRRCSLFHAIRLVTLCLLIL